MADCGFNTLKVTRKRLIKDGSIAIEREKNISSTGRNCLSYYLLNKNLYQEISSYNSNNSINTNITTKKKNEENYKTEKTTNQNTDTNSRSTFTSNNSQKPTNSLEIQNANVISKSELNNKRNENLKYEELPEEWKTINYHFLDNLHFKQHHIVGLYKLDVLEPEVVQESIEHFAYGIKNNPDSYKKYTDPLKVFYGSLRKGRPWTESTYKSTKEIATEDLVQRRKQEKRKLADQECEIIDNMEKEEYSRWQFNLTDKEKKEIREKHSKKENNIYSYYDEKILKLYYSREVMANYEDPKEKILAEYMEKKKEQIEKETQRISEMLQKSGMMKEYYQWLDKPTNEDLIKITERKDFTHQTMTQEDTNKLKVYFAKNVLMNKINK